MAWLPKEGKRRQGREGEGRKLKRKTHALGQINSSTLTSVIPDCILHVIPHGT
jgi:hypothetical protein